MVEAGMWIGTIHLSRANVFRHTLIPPRGYTIGGISGSCAQWLDGFQLIITR